MWCCHMAKAVPKVVGRSIILWSLHCGELGDLLNRKGPFAGVVGSPSNGILTKGYFPPLSIIA